MGDAATGNFDGSADVAAAETGRSVQNVGGRMRRPFNHAGNGVGRYVGDEIENVGEGSPFSFGSDVNDVVVCFGYHSDGFSWEWWNGETLMF